MRRGKECAQCAHGAVGVIAYSVDADGTWDARVRRWFATGQTKITVYVESEQELLELQKAADIAGILTYLVTDAGRTEFNGVPTNTVLVIGPDLVEKIDPITSHLPLY